MDINGLASRVLSHPFVNWDAHQVGIMKRHSSHAHNVNKQVIQMDYFNETSGFVWK